MPSNTVNYSAHLTNLAVGYMGSPRGLAYRELFPEFSVPLDVGKYKILDAARSVMRLDDTRVGPRDSASPLDFEWTEASFSATNFAKRTSRTPGELNPERDPNARANAVNSIIANLELNIENEAKTIFTGAVTNVADPTDWDDPDSEPISDVNGWKQTIRQAMRGTPGEYDIVLGLHEDVIDALFDHPDILGRFTGGATPGSPAVASLNVLAQILRVDRVVALEASYNSASTNKTVSLQDIWSKAGFITARARTIGREINTFGLGMVPRRTESGNPMQMINGMSVSEWWENDPRVWNVRADKVIAMKVINSNAGLYLDNLIA